MSSPRCTMLLVMHAAPCTSHSIEAQSSSMHIQAVHGNSAIQDLTSCLTVMHVQGLFKPIKAGVQTVTQLDCSYQQGTGCIQGVKVNSKCISSSLSCTHSHTARQLTAPQATGVKLPVPAVLPILLVRVLCGHHESFSQNNVKLTAAWRICIDSHNAL